MLIVTVTVALIAAAAAGAVVAFVVRRTVQAEAAGQRDALVAELGVQLQAQQDANLRAVVDSVTAAASEQLGRHTQSTVSTVLELAGDKLGQQTALAGQQLEQRHQAFERQIQGMNDELRQVRALVAELQKEKAQQHGQLVAGIEQAMRASESLAETTQRLRQALSNSRARGQWGERMADDVLRVAGFVEGVNYVRQRQLPDGGRPDITFLLPQDRVLHMDVKFPVDNYLRFLEAGEGPDAEVHRKAFLRDARARIKELTARSYTDPDTTVGYVLLFIPNEAV